MLFSWLLPDASYQVLFEGWDRQHYRPRHGKPPLVVRGAYSAAAAIGRARERYLGIEEDSLSSAASRRPQRADLASAGAHADSGTGTRRLCRARAGVGWRLPACGLASWLAISRCACHRDGG